MKGSGPAVSPKSKFGSQESEEGEIRFQMFDFPNHDRSYQNTDQQTFENESLVRALPANHQCSDDSEKCGISDQYAPNNK